MKTYYKVVKRIDDKLVSCVAYNLSRIEYAQNKWAKAPKWLRDLNKGPLVFVSLDDVKAFVKQTFYPSDVEIWEVRARCINTNPRIYKTWDLAEGKVEYSQEPFPTGTVEARQIKLIRRVV